MDVGEAAAGRAPNDGPFTAAAPRPPAAIAPAAVLR